MRLRSYLNAGYSYEQAIAKHLKHTIKSRDAQKGDYVVGYEKIVDNVWVSGFDNTVVITFQADGTQLLTMKSSELTVIR